MFALALGFASCSKEEFNSPDDFAQPTKKSVVKGDELPVSGMTGIDGDLIAQPDAKTSEVSVSTSTPSSPSDESGKTSISDDDDDENDDDRSQPTKPKKK